MAVHLKISYQYRDAGNNKNYDEIVLNNPSGISAEELLSLFSEAFIEDQPHTEFTHIRPDKIGLPTLYFDSYDSDLDHPLHEVLDISSTNESATLEISIDEIINRMSLRNKQRLSKTYDFNFF